MTQYIKESCGLPVNKSPTILYEDNAACIAQLKEGYIKSDRTKHIPLRFFSYNQELIKDNHIDAAGSITKAVKLAKEYAPFVRKIEVEVENLDMLREALEAGADIIMLDNMSVETMKEAVAIIDGRAQTECSGNVTKEKVKDLIDIGVDFISCGALTHSSPVLDYSMKNLTII